MTNFIDIKTLILSAVCISFTYGQNPTQYETSSSSSLQNIQLFKPNSDVQDKPGSDSERSLDTLSNKSTSHKPIVLPRVPIFIKGEQYVDGSLYGYYKYSRYGNAFLRLKVNQTIKEFDDRFLHDIGCFLLTSLAGYGLGISAPPNEIDYWDDDYNVDRESYNRDWDKRKKTSAWVFGFGYVWLRALSPNFFGAKTTQAYKDRFVENTFITEVKEQFKGDYYKDVLYNQKVNKGKKQYSHQIKMGRILHKLNNKYPLWFQLNALVNDYNQKFSSKDIDVYFQYQLSMFGSPKGEFETTFQYKERIRNENTKKQNLRALYEQDVENKRVEYNNNKRLLLRKIESIVDEIEFEIEYDYNISKYDADNQYFTFTIPEINEIKRLVVPISNAPNFKENDVPFYRIAHIMKPTLNGKWKKVKDDVVLIDSRDNSLIPWEGEMPSYATIPLVEAPNLLTEIGIKEPSGDGYLDAEEVATLKVSLINNGKGDAKMCQLNLTQISGPPLFYDVSKEIDYIPSNENRDVSFQIRIPENVTTGEATFKINIYEKQAYDPEPVTLKVDVRAQRPPILSVIDYGILDQNEDGRLTKNEQADITVRIQNRGQGEAKGVVIKVFDNPIQHLFLAQWSKKEFNVGNIDAGDFKDVTFTIVTNNRVAQSVSMKLSIEESRPRFSKEDSIKIEIDKIHDSLEPIVFQGKTLETKLTDLNSLNIDIEQNIPVGERNNYGIAIVIGNKNYMNSDVPEVTYAHRDATIMEKYLTKMFGYRDVIVEIDATQGKFNALFGTDKKDGKLQDYVKKNKSDVFIYYSGHGAPDPESNDGYFVPVDCDPAMVDVNGYSLDLFYKKMNNLDAKSVTVVIDACFSGSSDQGMLLKNISPVFIQVDESVQLANKVTVFTSASGDQVSSWLPEKKHSLYTYYFLKGIKGSADTNGDRSVTAEEIQSYVEEEVPLMARKLNSREQTPGMRNGQDKVIVQF